MRAPALKPKAELKLMLQSVDDLAKAMKVKLRQKFAQGKRGGLHRDSRYMVTKMLHEHVHRLTTMCPHCEVLDGEMEEEAQQAIDVCNLAMMLWVIGGSPT